MYLCKFNSCGHAKAEAAIGWNRFIPLCREHALKTLKIYPNHSTFRWL